MSVNLSINKNQYYCLRFRVHKKLIPFFKKSVISKSLSTKSKREAKLKANRIYYPYQQILSTVSIITSVQTQELVDTFIQEHLEQKTINVFTIDETTYKSVSRITLVQAYEKFLVWYKQQNITNKQYLLTTNKLTNLILPYLGEDTLIEDVTLETVEEFKEFLTAFPNINKKKYRQLTLAQIVLINHIPTSDMIGVSTQMKYLKILKQFFLYIVKANLLNYNPCSLLTMPNNTVPHREPFDAIELKKLFSIFNTLDDRKYIYYILAYTGMRPSELWKCKISSSEDNIIYFDLTDRGLELKTSSSHRVIPLHTRLLEMDVDKKLIEVQQKFTQAGISSYFNKTIKPMVTDNPNKVMYSFRSLVATELKRAEVNMDKVSELLGHSYENSTMTKEVYARGYTIAQLQIAINNLNYE